MSSLVQAIRDHEYMGRFTGQRDDPFVVSSKQILAKKILDRAMLRKNPEIYQLPHLQKEALATGPWEDGGTDMRPIGGTRGEAYKHASYSLVGGSPIGAAFLIDHMWLLVLKQEVFLQLGVATGCMVAFGLIMAVYLETLDAVFAATLAYAAVLMSLSGL